MDDQRRASTRRAFLVGSAASTVSASVARIVGANERVNVAIIGVGGKGFSHLRALTAQAKESADVQVVAVCDIYTRWKHRAKALSGLTDKDIHHDYRELLARSDVDAVFIATPDHWHARMAIDAMAAGKDVYLQKPMSLTIEEAQRVAAAAPKYKRVLQIGSQYASDPRHHKARELIEQGEIGELLWAQGTYSRNSKVGEWNYYVDEEASPETIDWRRWLGPAPKRPFSAERYFRWRKYWDYSGGIATDLFYHKLTPLLYAMGPQYPVSATGSGGIYVQKDREVPDTYATVIEYPGFYINMSSSMANAAALEYFPEVIYGHKGTITFDQNKVIVVPERTFLPGKIWESVKKGRVFEMPPTDIDRRHTDDFFACVRSRQKPVLNGEFGCQVMVAIQLGVESYRERRLKFFDPRTQKVVDKGTPRAIYQGDGRNQPSGYQKRV